MKQKRIHRRTFLRGAGGIAIALPFLDIMQPRKARAGGNEPPKRLVLFFTANGTQPSSWKPAETGENYQLSPILQPLAAHQQDIIVLSGLDMKSSGGDKKGHNRGVGCLWTGRTTIDGNEGDTSYASGISVDQYLVSKLEPDTALNSLELGVKVYFTIPRGRMIYTGPNQPVPPEDNPFAAFNRLFGSFGEDEAAIEKIRARRHTVIDAVKDDFSRLDKMVGKADRIKLDQHLTSIREIEQRLDNLGGIPEACSVPQMPPYFNWKSNEKVPQIGDLQMELLVMALACDQTRFASIMWGGALSNFVFSWLGHSAGHHELSHSLSDPTSRDQIVEINTWYAERFADLLSRMKNIQEANGTLLDNTVVVWGSELGKGQPHYCLDIPFVLAGSAGGYFKTGQHVAYPGRSHNDLLITLMHAMGNEENEFGDPAHCTGPLEELKA